MASFLVSVFNVFPDWTILIAVFWVLTAIINIAFAAAVYADSKFLKAHLKRGTFLVGGGIWALATLLGGILTVALYWLIHHSTLRPAPFANSPPEPAKPEKPEA